MRLALLVLLVACDPPPLELKDVPCEGTQLTYEGFGRPFFATYCNGCHAGSLHGAPTTFHFDSLDDIHLHIERIFVRAAGPNTSMPPGPDDPPAAERDKLAEWLACGAPP